MDNKYEIINIKDLHISYIQSDKKIPVIENFNLRINKGESVGIFGESGCGKSTILRCIAGLIPSYYKGNVKGHVLINNKSIFDLTIAERTKYIGMVSQNPDTQLFSDTVQDEIAFGLENICLPNKEIIERVNKYLNFIGLEEYRYTSPSLLSGGQKQMVVLASVLAMNPKVLLLDEAFSQLDNQSTTKMLDTIKNLQSQGQTMIVVDHELKNLESLDRIIYLDC